MNGFKNGEEAAKKKLLECLEQTFGVITAACKKAGVSRASYYKWMLEPEFKEAVEDVNEIILDFVESRLLNNIKSGSERSIEFFLKSKGRKRGYNNDLNIKSDGDNAININYILPKNDQ
jgi:hypothetical protein